MQYQKILPGIFFVPAQPVCGPGGGGRGGGSLPCKKYRPLPGAAGPRRGSTWRRAGSPGARQNFDLIAVEKGER